MMRRRDILALLGFVLFAFLPGIIGSLSVGEMRGFYQQIDRPSWSPPGWVFGPVWTVLYTTIGIAGFLVYRQLARPQDGAFAPLGRAPDAFVLFVVQLLLNGIWTPVFFGLQSILGGAVVIIGLWLAIVANLLLFLRIRVLAGLLLLPYLAWVTFAGVLNWTLWHLN